MSNNQVKQNLVIIPGWGGTKQSWKGFIEKAEDYFEVRCLEMPCFGDNPCPKDVWGVDEYADWAAKEIADLERPIVLGHSFGGQIAVNLASRSDNPCSKLILSGAAVLRNENSIKKAIFLVLAKTGKIFFSLPILKKSQNLFKKILYKAADSPDYGKTQGIEREIFKKIIRQSQKEKLNPIKVPTLVVWGSRDSYVPLKEGKIIASLVPSARLEIIKNGKHGLHISNADKLLELVKNFSSEN